MTRPTQNIPEWPTWLIDFLPGIAKTLSDIDLVIEKLADRVDREFVTQHVPASWLEAVVEKIGNDLARQDRALESDKVFYAFLTRTGESVRLLDQITYVRAAGIFRQIATAKKMLADNDFVGAMIMFRGLIELAANYLETLRLVGNALSTEKTFDSKFEAVDTILAQRMGATRISWLELLNSDINQVFKLKELKGKFEYQQGESAYNYKSKGVMSEIDQLNKKVAGSRVTYEILCEFLHPNLGTFLGITHSVRKHTEPRTGTPLIHKKFSVGAPPDHLERCPELYEKIFEKTSKILQQFIALIDIEAPPIRSELSKMAKEMISYRLKNNPGFKHRNLLCPCGDGKPLKKCCGKPTTG